MKPSNQEQHASRGQSVGPQTELEVGMKVPIPEQQSVNFAPKSPGLVPIDNKDRRLPLLNYRPFFLQSWVLVFTILVNLSWISWLAIVYTTASFPPFSGSNFILGGLFSGYVATAAKFFITAQIMSMGKIVPYRNMLSSTGPNVQNSIDSDYWPYEWPVVRFRAFRNGDFFFQFVDIVAFLFTYAVVQFESNILSQDDAGNYTPHHGVIIIVIICHAVVTITTFGILVWVESKETGLLADPGCLALYLALLDKDDILKDFQGIEAEDRRWKVRKRLANNNYSIGYWREGNQAVYGIRRKRVRNNSEPVSETILKDRKNLEDYPEFQYIPWFLESLWVTIWTAILAAGLAIIATLVIHDDIITNGFAPHAPTSKTPFVEISPASFVWSFFPSFAAELFVMLVQSTDIFYRLVQPYADMKQKDAKAKRIINCFKINYTNDLPIVVTLRALSNCHFSVAFISAFSLSASLVPAWAANMFYVYEEWVYVWPQAFYPLVVYMGLFILFFLWVIPDRSRYMPRDLETIADHMALYSQSSLLENDVFHFKVDVPSGPRTKSESISVTLKGWPSSISSALRTAQTNGWKKTLSKYMEMTLGPPEVIKSVLETLEEHSRLDDGGEFDSTKLPRFGTWAQGDSYRVGIDYNKDNKMLSLFENKSVRDRLDDFFRSCWEQMF